VDRVEVHGGGADALCASQRLAVRHAMVVQPLERGLIAEREAAPAQAQAEIEILEGGGRKPLVEAPHLA